MTDRLTERAWIAAQRVPARRGGSTDRARDAYRWKGQAISPPLSALLLHAGAQMGQGRIRGLGPHGIKLETEAEVDEGEHLQVRFTLPDEGGQDVQYGVRGRVVSRAGGEIGLLTDMLDPPTREGLQALLAFSRQVSQQIMKKQQTAGAESLNVYNQEQGEVIMNTLCHAYPHVSGAKPFEGDPESFFWAAWANPEDMAKRVKVELPGAGDAADTREEEEFYCDWS